MPKGTKPGRVREAPWLLAARDGRVQLRGGDEEGRLEYRVEMTYQDRQDHVIELPPPPALLPDGSVPRRLPHCLDCRTRPNLTVEKMLDCERAVLVFRRMETRRQRKAERRRLKDEGVDRVRTRDPLYYAARREAPFHFLHYLTALIRGLPFEPRDDPRSEHWKPSDGATPPQGRRPADPWDLMLVGVLYALRARTSLIELHQYALQLYREGWLRTVPAENWPSIALGKPWFRGHVRRLIGESVWPIAHTITVLTIDKTGASREKRHRYREDAWGMRGPPKDMAQGYDDGAEYEKRRLYDGLHIISCVHNGVIVAADVTPGTSHESKFLLPLLDDAIRVAHVRPGRLMADAGYSFPHLVQDCWDMHHVELLTPMKSNVGRRQDGCPRWTELWDHYWLRFESFVDVYGVRSLSETMNSAIKQKHGERTKSTEDRRRGNEILSKVLAFNVNRVIALLWARQTPHPLLKEEAPPFAGRGEGPAAESVPVRPRTPAGPIQTSLVDYVRPAPVPLPRFPPDEVQTSV